MQRSFKKVTTVLVVLCLLFGGVGLAPEIANTTGSPVTKAATKYTRFVKPTTLKVYKKASASSKVVATLKKDKKVTQYGSANKKGWVKIRYASGKYGYVKKTNLKTHMSKAGLLALAKKQRKKILSIVEEYGWSVEFATEPELIVYDDEDGIYFTRVEFYVTIKNAKYTYEMYASCYFYDGVFEYDSHVYKGSVEKKSDVGHNFDTLLSYIKKYAV